MTLHQQGFDGLPILAGVQFLVSQAMLNIDSRIEISMCTVATDHAAKRLLVMTIGPIWIVTYTALLRGISALDPDGGYAPLGGVPGDLFGDMGEVGGTHVGIHGVCLVFHRRDREMFIRKLRTFV